VNHTQHIHMLWEQCAEYHNFRAVVHVLVCSVQ